MSCNIESIRIIRQVGDLTISRTEFALMQATTHNRPGFSFLEYRLDDPLPIGKGAPSRRQMFTQAGEILTAYLRLPWCSDGSGTTFETYKTLLSKFSGEADLLVFWEGSELSGLRLKDGVVTEHDVVTTLKETT